MEMFRQY